MDVRTRVGNLIASALLVSAIPVSLQSTEDYRRPAKAVWSTVGGDWGNSRLSALTQITPDNVARLGGVWMSRG